MTDEFAIGLGRSGGQQCQLRQTQGGLFRCLGVFRFENRAHEIARGIRQRDTGTGGVDQGTRRQRAGLLRPAGKSARDRDLTDL